MGPALEATRRKARMTISGKPTDSAPGVAGQARPAALLAAVCLTALPMATPVSAQEAREEREGACLVDQASPPSPAIHCLRLIPTRNGQGYRGVVRLTWADSPFGVTVSEDGRYVYDVQVRLTHLPRNPNATYVAWATTRDLEDRRRIGVLGDDLTAVGQIDWNRFMLLVTEERSPDVEAWQGPILLTAMSPSSWMHTMGGEAIFGDNERPIGKRYCLVNDC